MIISWLVFSDLHFQFSNAESQNARERLVSYVAEESMKNGPIDFILTTGDCFHQYKQNTDIKKRLIIFIRWFRQLVVEKVMCILHQEIMIWRERNYVYQHSGITQV